MRAIVGLLEELLERDAVIDRRPAQAGDVRRTAADTSRAREGLGRQPSVGLRDGLRSQLDWVQARRAALAGTVRFRRRRPAASAGVPTGATGGGGIG